MTADIKHLEGLKMTEEALQQVCRQAGSTLSYARREEQNAT